jgi:hypothetical protein
VALRVTSDSPGSVLEAMGDAGSWRTLRFGSLVGDESFLNDLRETLELYPLSAFARPFDAGSSDSLPASDVGEGSPPTYPESNDLGR